MLFTPPLSKEDAETIEHAAEVRMMECSMPRGPIEAVARYGEARRWLFELLQGRAVEIDEAELAHSRDIMTRHNPFA